MTVTIRLNKFISDSGVCSRREADKYIEQGHVFVNGRRASIGDQVSAKDKVLLNGNLLEAKVGEDFVFLAFNKPVGIISTTEIGVKDSIIDYIGYHERIFPVGRLDKDSQGLIFLTNNGDIVNKILRAGNKHEKEYFVTVNKPITDEFIQRMSNGVPMLGETTKKCKVVKESVYTFRIILIQGLNRQIRRMCEYFEYEVVKLERIRIMSINLKGLPIGEWRQLQAHEITEVMASLANSNPQHETQNPKPETRNPHPEKRNTEHGTRNTKQSKKSDRSSNPKSKELRGQSANSTGNKNSSPRSGKPYSSFSNHKSAKR